MERERGPGTRAVHAGVPAPEQGAPFLPGPTFAGPYHLAGDPSTAPYGYARYGNPTWSAYEDAVGELEGGSAVAFASGMAACAAIAFTFLKPGDVLVAPSDGYPVLRTLAATRLAELGVETRFVPTAGDWTVALDGARVVWLETPSNPWLDLCDISAVAAAAHERGALVVADNTLATPLGQQPLALGCDLSVAADTNAIQSIQQTQPQNLVGTLVHIFPASIVDALLRGDVLQIVAFSVLFAMAVSAIGEKGRPILRACESLSQIMFRFTSYVMLFAPIGVGAAMAHTIATQGLEILWHFAKLIGSLYLALVVFVFVVLGAVALIARIPVRKFIKAVREPATIAFVTTSSESALPKATDSNTIRTVPTRGDIGIT